MESHVKKIKYAALSSLMVRFKVNYGAHIARNLHYLDYDRMKVILHEQEREETKSLLTPAEHDHASKFSEVFFEEVARVDNCYTQHMIDLDYMLVDMQRLANEYSENKSKEKWRKKAQEAALKRSATTLHNKLAKLETYRLLNRTAAIKILKKHDKLAKETNEASFLVSHMAMVDKTSFGDGTKLSTMRAQLEGLYADVFCHGILEEAQGKLRLAKTLTNPVILLGVAFKVGIVITLLAWLANNFIVAPRLSLLYLTVEDPSVYVYAAVGALLTYRWLWGFCVYMWDSVDIDYILILDLDANKHMPSSDQIFSDTGNLTILYLINVLLFHSLRYYYKFRAEGQAGVDSAEDGIAWLSERAYIMPVLLVVGTLIRVSMALCDPSSKGVFSTKTFTKLASAPFSAVHLRHTYAADILCSLTKVFAALLYSGCYFTSGAYLYASDPTSAEGKQRFAVCSAAPLTAVKVFFFLYPIFIRIMQCLRQRRDHFVRLAQVTPSKIAQINEQRKGDEPQEEKTATGSTAVLHASGATQRPLGLRSRSLTAGAAASSMMETSSVTGAVTTKDAVSTGPYGALADEEGQTYDDDTEHIFRTAPTLQEEEGGDSIESQQAARHLELELGLRPVRGNGIFEDGPNDLQDGGLDDHDSSDPGSESRPFNGGVGVRNKPKAVRRPSLSKGESFDIPTPAYMKLGGILGTIWVWPYSYNALRYVLTFVVVLFGSYPPQDPASSAFISWYVPLCVISTLYSCYWDVANDFKLMQGTAPKPLLRDKLFYEESEYFYYLVLVLNPVLRFMWTLAFTPYGHHPFLVCFEILRRSLWACMRMELGYIQELARRK